MTKRAAWVAAVLVAGSTATHAQDAPHVEAAAQGNEQEAARTKEEGTRGNASEPGPALPSAQPRDEVPPVRIVRVSATGSGCPNSEGLLEAACTSDQHCRVALPRYFLAARPGEDAFNGKFCTVKLNVVATPGTQVAISRFSLLATVGLTRGATAEIDGIARFVGALDSGARPSRIRLEGPYPTDGNPYVRLDGTPTPPLWTPCGYAGALEVRTSISLTNNSGEAGFVSVDEVTASFIDRVDTRPPGLDVAITSRRCGPHD